MLAIMSFKDLTEWEAYFCIKNGSYAKWKYKQDAPKRLKAKFIAAGMQPDGK